MQDFDQLVVLSDDEEPLQPAAQPLLAAETMDAIMGALQQVKSFVPISDMYVSAWILETS